MVRAEAGGFEVVDDESFVRVESVGPDEGVAAVGAGDPLSNGGLGTAEGLVTRWVGALDFHARWATTAGVYCGFEGASSLCDELFTEFSEFLFLQAIVCHFESYEMKCLGLPADAVSPAAQRRVKHERHDYLPAKQLLPFQKVQLAHRIPISKPLRSAGFPRMKQVRRLGQER